MTAANAPVAAVIARLPGPSRWTCFLRWDLRTKQIEQGAWTTLRVKDRICKLSPDGQFLLYFGKGPLQGPFAANYGGGAAVSRLPWLAALTNISPGCTAGGGPSRHALDSASQQRLWKLFESDRFYFRSDDWPGHYGPMWQRARGGGYRAEQVPAASQRQMWYGVAEIPQRGLRLVLAAHRRYLNSSSGPRQSFFLESSRHTGELRPLPDVCWAQPRPSGSLLVATTTGRLRELYPKSAGDPHSPFKVIQDHDLTRLRHRPGPAPPWAIAPLGTPRRKTP
jgi:hypothetical protein